MFYSRTELLAPEECLVITKMIPRLFPSTTASFASPPILQSPYRIARSAMLPDWDFGGIASDRIRESIRRANQVLNLNFEIAATEPIQYIEYSIGGHYKAHLDIGPSMHARRKLSASVQLSDPKDYDGGALILGTEAAPRDQGSIAVFPSYLLHTVEPVTRGIRRVLVAWAVGEHPYR